MRVFALMSISGIARSDVPRRHPGASQGNRVTVYLISTIKTVPEGEKAAEILDAYGPLPLDEDVEKEIERISK